MHQRTISPYLTTRSRRFSDTLVEGRFSFLLSDDAAAASAAATAAAVAAAAAAIAKRVWLCGCSCFLHHIF